MCTYTSYDLVEWGQPFRKRKQTLQKPKGVEVLIRVKAAGLCHSDLHVKKGYMDLGEEGRLTFADRGAKLPMTFGHEIAGIVEEIGEAVTKVKVGQQVLIFPWVGCGSCAACEEERESDCSDMRIIGLKQKGGFATHCLVENERFLVNIDGLDASDVVPHACSGVTVYNALEKLGKLRDEEWLAVIGCGGLGLNAISIATAMGFKKIMAMDINDEKLSAAKEMGATTVLNNSRPDTLQKVQQLTGGQLTGVVDTHGSSDSGMIAVRAIAKTGQYVIVGQAGGDFKMPQVWLPQKAMTVRGSHVGNSPQLRKIIEMVRSKKIKQMPIDKRPLSQINDAILDLEAGNVLGRIVFEPENDLEMSDE